MFQFSQQMLLPVQNLPLDTLGRERDERAPPEVSVARQDGAEESRVGDGRPQRLPLQDLQLCRDSQARQYRQPPEAEAQYFAHGLRSEVRVRQVTQQIKLPFQYSQ